MVTATVRDGNGKLVTGLPKEAFEIYEDGERLPIAQFTNERVPLGLGLLLDISDSMFGRRMKDARRRSSGSCSTCSTPTDAFFLMAFNHDAAGAVRLEDRARTACTSALGEPAARPGSTAIYDAIVAALPSSTTGRASARPSCSSPTAPTRRATRRCTSCGRR